MKKISLTLFTLVAFAVTAFAQEKVTLSTEEQGKIEFEKTSHDFGTITEGTQATIEFKFKNTGKAPIVLSNVRPSCGCTTPKWTREPVAPGETGVITAIYNSKGRPGNFTKSITVTHNGEGGTDTLVIKGYVQPKAKTPESPVKVD